MKRLILVIVLSLASVSQATYYRLKVVFPDSEEKTFQVNEKEQSLKLGSNEWACSFERLPGNMPDGSAIKRVYLECKTTGGQRVTGNAICDAKGPFAVSGMTILDSTSREWKFILSCEW